jgi:hypothetical protein
VWSAAHHTLCTEGNYPATAMLVLHSVWCGDTWSPYLNLDTRLRRGIRFILKPSSLLQKMGGPKYVNKAITALYIYIYTHKQTHRHTQTQTHKHKRTHTHKHTHTNSHTNTRTQTQTHTHYCDEAKKMNSFHWVRMIGPSRQSTVNSQQSAVSSQQSAVSLQTCAHAFQLYTSPGLL